MLLQYVQIVVWHYLAEISKAFPKEDVIRMVVYVAPKPVYTTQLLWYLQRCALMHPHTITDVGF